MVGRTAHRSKSAVMLPVATVPIVGVGASAGGLRAFVEMLSALSADSGMAFVLIQHLDPSRESMLAPLLARKSVLPVSQVTDGMAVEPNRVYVIPPNTTMGIYNGLLRLTERNAVGESMPIDHFFQSLAAYANDAAIGVVLSGTATDGTLGLQAIRAEGGICFAQDEESAKYAGMPASAIAAGCVDFILPPTKIAAELSRIARERCLNALVNTSGDMLPAINALDLGKLFLLLRHTTGADFSRYKSSTIHRRIARRMLLRKTANFPEYLQSLQRDGTELDALYQDILIHVTSFFREPEAFEILEKRIIPKLIESRQEIKELRVWVAGCSTGEEAYSIAMVLAEHLGDRLEKLPVQIFGTDLNESSIEHARAGVYKGSALTEVRPERLERFFVKQNDGYRVTQSIRDMCTFARQDLTQDPAFSRIDLITCRNVLIYLEPLLQRKILASFHYALNNKGILLLGKSETLNAFPDLFTRVERGGNFFRKKAGANLVHLRRSAAVDLTGQPGRPPKPSMAPSNLPSEADRLIWTHYRHAGVIVDDNLHILHFRGDVSPYLSPTSGAASLHLLKMVRSELLLDLRAVFHKAKKENEPARWDGCRLHFGDRVREISVEVIPLSSLDAADRQFLILFEEVRPVLAEPTGTSKASPTVHRKLRQEVKATRDYLRAIIEEQETTNEELKAANEEALSNNEELQSSNEELETAKEELQSTNEELGTLTEQQAARNIELTQLNDDLRNVFEGLQIPILLLDGVRRVRRFNRSAEQVFNLLPTDVGRPIQDLRPNLDVSDLQPLISSTLETRAPQRQDVRDLDGRYYTMSVRPYTTSDGKVDGVVIKLLDIDTIKRSLVEAERARDYANAIVETVREPLVVLDSAFLLVTANRSFCETFQVSREQVGKRSIFEIAEGGWDNPELRELLGKIRLAKTRYENVRVSSVFPRVGQRTLVLNARRLEWEGDGLGMILLAMEDLTEQETTNESLRQSHERLRYLTGSLLDAQEEERGRISRELHDDFNQRLAMVAVELQNLEKTPFLQSAQLPRTMVASLRTRTETISDDLRKLAHRLHPSVVEHLGLSAALRSLCEDFRNQEHLQIEYRERGLEDLKTPPDIALCIYRVAQAALHNVVRHSGSNRATVTLSGRTDRILLSVSDYGAGFDLTLDRVGKGLGILSMEERARLAVGAFTIHSKPGAGTRVALEIPLVDAVLSEEAS